MGGGLAGRYREIKRERERQGDRQTDRTGQDRTGQAADPRDKEFPKKKNDSIFTNFSFPERN